MMMMMSAVEKIASWWWWWSNEQGVAVSFCGTLEEVGLARQKRNRALYTYLYIYVVSVTVVCYMSSPALELALALHRLHSLPLHLYLHQLHLHFHLHFHLLRHLHHHHLQVNWNACATLSLPARLPLCEKRHRRDSDAGASSPKIEAYMCVRLSLEQATHSSADRRSHARTTRRFWGWGHSLVTQMHWIFATWIQTQGQHAR